ncbi:MAG: DUF350 domain-containing protein [Elusimicrobiota bacterium]
MDIQRILIGIGSSIFYSFLGMAMFLFAYWLLEKITPWSLEKELVEDQNTAVGIVVGSMMVGLAIVIAASIHG